jgi:UDP-GlcNAc:undecaprenyl-phosphate/decaprenyl-phosphate GlcNAc-1-phosphate transferase
LLYYFCTGCSLNFDHLFMTSIIQVVFAFIIGAFWVYLTVPIIVRVSKAKKLFDVPDERKISKIVIPNLGGISLFIGISVATLLSLDKLYYPDFRYTLAGMIILLFIGIKDDIMVISARKKFIAQLICALILIIAGDIRLTNLHGVLGIHEINYVVSLGVSLLAIVAIINALNMIDGIDGLAAALGTLICLSFGILFLTEGQLAYGILCFAATGSLSVFYFYNVFGKLNKIFMGDTGSLIIGLLAAVFVIKFNEFSLSGNEQLYRFSPSLSMAIIAVPFFDLIRVSAIRISRKKSPVNPDMKHIHHRLLRLGFSHQKSTFILIASNLFLIGFTFLLRTLNINLQLFLLISISFLFSFIPDLIYLYSIKKTIQAHYIDDDHLFDADSLMELSKQEFEETRLTLNELDRILPKKNNN